ncbi:two-component system osmolarity sensor histidine kinase EnvZ [Paraburkholderia phenoliruptrix]|uniref:ATP-binding protein n=1 Tax=Paraburkholderia phenoliruptrix TaxID=252970 RepID=UPI002858FAFF|nr:ATP-binding protein [Paraburkholderia phenoliruptrix]MDR6423817.1 two-component system osmolarity sensor histidine kinase EnvZ [Paraburkholderia phenoliruptrix]
MNNPIDTLFGRLALMTVGLIVVVHLASAFVVDRNVAEQEIDQARRIVMLAARAKQAGGEAPAVVAATLDTEYVAVEDAIAHGCPAPCTDTHGPEDSLRDSFPLGSQVVLDRVGGTLWARYPHERYWIAVPIVAPLVSRLLWLSTLMLALAIAMAIIGAWRLQRPLRQLARAAREFRADRRAPVIAKGGPREVRELIGDFNEMVREISHTEQERAVMLAGLAHDLRAPITRMQVRADLLPDEASRSGFLRDTESLSRIVMQFLDFARETTDVSLLACVDAHCLRHYGDCVGKDSPIELNLHAGAGFSLPLSDLDRILTNLIENALTYGEPPVKITSFARHDTYALTVRDHGAGIPAEDLERVSRPFVRLDAARGGDAHCGLGLAIVRRLTQRNGGTFSVGNAAGGGFMVALTFARVHHRA